MKSYVWAAKDPIENLIESERIFDDITERSSDLPSMFLFGDKHAVKLYSLGTQKMADPWLCRSLALDELGDLNLNIPRVRKTFEESCLVRLNDFFMAVGPGFQTPVSIKRFVVRSEPRGCATESPLTLWGEFDEVLERDPLFFSTDLDLPEGFNGFKSIQDFPEYALDEPKLSLLENEVPFFSDYQYLTRFIGAPNCELLVFLNRKEVDFEDDGLPNEMVLSLTSGRVNEVWLERVNRRSGSGHIRIVGFLDFNGDDFLDLYLQGDHQNCAYSTLLKGTNQGFENEDLPVEPCGCE